VLLLRPITAVVALVACSASRPAPVVAPLQRAPAIPLLISTEDAGVELDVSAPDRTPVVARSAQEVLVRALATGATTPVEGIDFAAGFQSANFATVPGSPPRDSSGTSSSGWGVCRAMASGNVDRLRRELGVLVMDLDAGASLTCEGDECTTRGQSGRAWFVRFATADGGTLRLRAIYVVGRPDAGRDWIDRSRTHLRNELQTHPCR
jgi:hypothetical protein